MKLKDRAILFYEYDSKGGRDVDDGKVLVVVQVLVLLRVAMRWYQEKPEEERLHHVSPDHPQQGNHQQQSAKPKDIN